MKITFSYGLSTLHETVTLHDFILAFILMPIDV